MNSEEAIKAIITDPEIQQRLAKHIDKLFGVGPVIFYRLLCAPYL